MKYFFLILAFSFLNLSYADVCSPDPAQRFSKYSKPQSNAPKEISFDGQILTRRTFKTEAKEGPFGSYITLDLDLPPFEHLYNQLKKDYPNLKNRGEAHITVLTPVEFYCQFKPAGTTIKQLEDSIFQFMKENNFKLDFKYLSLGSHQVEQKETFFIIVESQDLIKLRSKWAEFPNKGFKAENFYPHVTVGFTDQDLHSSQGVIKDEEHSHDYRYHLNLIVK